MATISKLIQSEQPSRRAPSRGNDLMACDTSNIRVALLTNNIQPYRLAVWEALAVRVDTLRVFLSHGSDLEQHWFRDWGSLDVYLQGHIELPFRGGRSNDPSTGFTQNSRINIPYKTFRHLNEFHPDVVISVMLGARTVLAALWCIWHRDTRLIVDLHLVERTEQDRGRLRNIVRKWLLPRANAILINGPSGISYLRRFNIQDERVFHCTQVTDPSEFLKIPLVCSRQAARRLLIVGRLIKRKGLIPFITVLARWATDHPGEAIDLCIVGIGPQRDEILALEVPENVRINLVGHVQYFDLPKYYADTEIVAFPTLADEWGLVVNEALAAGLPVLGSIYSQAVVELIQEDVTGWCFKPDETESAYKAIDKALSAPAENISRMRTNCRDLGSKITPALAVEEMLQAIRYSLRV